MTDIKLDSTEKKKFREIEPACQAFLEKYQEFIESSKHVSMDALMLNNYCKFVVNRRKVEEQAKESKKHEQYRRPFIFR